MTSMNNNSSTLDIEIISTIKDKSDIKDILSIRTGKIQKLIHPLLIHYQEHHDEESKLEIIEYLKICDLLHAGQECLQFTISDIPDDTYYEHVKNIVKYNPDPEFCNTVFPMGSVGKDSDVQYQKVLYNSMSSLIVTPKYDGASIGIVLKRNPYGNGFIVDYATTRQRKVCTTAIRSLIKSVYFSSALKRIDLKEFGMGGVNLNRIQKIMIRGEFILRCKHKDVVSAATVSGYLKKGPDTIKQHKQDLKIVCYEIASIEFGSREHMFTHATLKTSENEDINTSATQIASATQLQSLILLNNMIADDGNKKYILGTPYLEFSGDKIIEFANNTERYFVDFEKLRMPLDGLVYCDSQWIYPLDPDAFNKANYGKMAWKPSPIFETFITGIKSTMSNAGKYSFSISVLPIDFEGKKHENTKMQYYDIQKKNLQIGDHVRVKLSNGINLQIIDKLHDSKFLCDKLVELGLFDEEYNLYQMRPNHFELFDIDNKAVHEWLISKPHFGENLHIDKVCKSCKSTLSIGDKEIFCMNDNCGVRLIEKYKFLVANVKKYSSIELNIYSKDHSKFVQKTLDESRIRDMYDSKEGLNLESLIREIPNFKECFNSLSLSQQAFCLKLGGEKTLEKKPNEVLIKMIQESYLFRY